ncbi:MAG: bifunctional oligoribonuclease/PAP phosphatase NrnA [Chloroflexi bacterium]|nr:bifunctional oligoribonuclease/PAP phosphatase NrnA [Chloroflexota bacterium]
MKTTKTATLTESSEHILRARQPLLICHSAPDGDAIGSTTGLARALRQSGRSPILACVDPVPTEYLFLAEVESFLSVVDMPFDLVITLDCSDLSRAGRLTETPGFDTVPLINIDHHITNLHFGDINLVSVEAASTAEVVLALLDAMHLPVDVGTANCLLTGILTDTRGLRTSNVTIEVVESALRLMKTGASLTTIIQNTLERRSTAALRLWGAALSRMKLDHGIIWATIPAQVRRAVHYSGNGDAGLASFLLSSDQANIAAVLVERDDQYVEVGFRAVPGHDVAAVALELGGGGHTLAAGCTVPGPLEDAEARVINLLKSSLASHS